MNSIVYVVMDPRGKNLLPAKEFGELYIMLNGREPNDFALERLRESLAHFRETDYLLLIGNPVFIGLASAIILERLKRVNFLVWDPHHYNYKLEKIEYGTHKSTDASASK